MKLDQDGLCTCNTKLLTIHSAYNIHSSIWVTMFVMELLHPSLKIVCSWHQCPGYFMILHQLGSGSHTHALCNRNPWWSMIPMILSSQEQSWTGKQNHNLSLRPCFNGTILEYPYKPIEDLIRTFPDCFKGIGHFLRTYHMTLKPDPSQWFTDLASAP